MFSLNVALHLALVPSDALSIHLFGELCTVGPSPLTQCPFLTRNTSARGQDTELE